MAEKAQPIQDKDLPGLWEAFASMSTGEEITKITGIFKNGNTARVSAYDVEEDTPLDPLRILRALDEIPSYGAPKNTPDRRERITKNFQTIADLGSFALEVLTKEKELHSIKTLSEVQKSLHRIMFRLAMALGGTALDKRDAAEAISYISSVVSPKTRIYGGKRLNRERFEP